MYPYLRVVFIVQQQLEEQEAGPVEVLVVINLPIAKLVVAVGAMLLLESALQYMQSPVVVVVVVLTLQMILVAVAALQQEVQEP